MGNSTVTVITCFDIAAGMGIPDPRNSPSGFGNQLALNYANNVMTDIVAERFNWKWNRAAAPPFYTNSFQQDYPQIGLTNIGWLEDADRIDINNTTTPKPTRQLNVRRQLSTAATNWAPVTEICWMYNRQLNFGTWPGAGVVFSPLVGSIVKQNPLLNMIDAHGNRLIVTSFGTTGSTAPLLTANAAEGTTVTDGSVIWTVVDPDSQGFRISPLPGAAGPVLKIVVYYQMAAPPIKALGATIDPIPDDYARFFQQGIQTYCLEGSPNPGDQKRGEGMRRSWNANMVDCRKQGDRESNIYSLLPASSVVEPVYPFMRNPQDPSQPY